MTLARYWAAAAAALLLSMAAIQVTGALQDTQTYDEATHLAAGYAYLRTGRFHINPEHPPLAKLLAALPLLPLSPSLPAEDPAWGGDQRMFGAVFLYRNRVDADTLLFLGRAVTMAATLALGLLMAIWTHRRFGPGPALAALFLYAFDANVLAHGRYVTNDVPTALACFAACIAWGAWLERPSRLRLAGAGALLGLALATKFSSVFLVPVFALLWAVRWWQTRVRPSLAALAAAPAVALAVVALVYTPETARVLLHPSAQPRLADTIVHNTAFGRALYSAGTALHLPAHTWLVGLESAERHDRNGHPSYLLGEASQTGGWWYYFPVVFAVKAPVALLAACALALTAALLGLRRANLRAAGFHWWVVAVPLAVYLGLTLRTRLNIGYRHLLPAYPFLLILVSAALFAAFGRRRAVLAAVLVAGAVLHSVEAYRIHPNQLAFFNLLAGGPARGADYVLDSNLDWGQDLTRLRRWLDAHGNPPVCLAYFGTADTVRYGVPHNGIPKTWDSEARGRLDCVAAISATLLHDLYIEPGAYQWLRDRHPMDHAGWSIYLYDLRRR